MFSYLREPGAIYRRSFEIIDAEANLAEVPLDVRALIVRLIHACGMTDIIQDLAFSSDIATVARSALSDGAPVLVDVGMVRQGITDPVLSTPGRIVCTLDLPAAGELAERRNITRSAAAVELWAPYLPGAVVAVGNAPTALFRLMELLDEGAPKPAAIFGFPVGFVGAAEAKAELMSDPRGVPYMTIQGRRGGSAFAAAAINALTGNRE